LLSQPGSKFGTENTDLSYIWRVIMLEKQEMCRGAKVKQDNVKMQGKCDYSVLKLKQNRLSFMAIHNVNYWQWQEEV